MKMIHNLIQHLRCSLSLEGSLSSSLLPGFTLPAQTSGELLQSLRELERN